MLPSIVTTSGLISAVNLSAGATSGNLSAMTFSNSNGVSFGLTASTITASHNGLTSQSNQNVTAGNGGFAFQTLSFSNVNGISFGTSAGSAITASYTVPTVPAQFSGGISTNGNTSGDTGLVTGRLALIGGNNITLSGSTNGGSISLTISAANAGGAQTGISGIQVSNTTYTSGTVTWQNANGISFGSSGANGVSASYTVPTITSWTVSDSATSATVGRLAFTASNGLTLTLSTSNNGNHTVIGSYTVPTVTNSSMSVSDAATSGTLARLAFTNLNGVTLSLSTGAGGSHTIVGSHNALTSQSNQNVTAANGGFAFQTLSFSNLNGISFGTSAGSAITASHNALTTARASTDAIGLNTAQTNVTWTVNSSGLSLNAAGYAGTGTTFAGANISASMTLNSNGLNLSASVAAGGGVNPVASASNGSFSFTTLNFSNANNVTFGTSAGSIITASVAAPGAAAENNWVNLLGANTAGNTTASGSTIGYSGINMTLSGTNGSVVNFSVPATSSLSATGILSISTNGSTISIGAATANFYATNSTTQNSSSNLDLRSITFNATGNGISVGYSNGSIVLSGQPHVSSYENIPVVPATSAMTWNGASVSHAVGFNLPYPVSASFLRLYGLMTTNSTTLATMASASASASGGLYSTINAVIYSYGTGASSRSLISVASGSGGYTMTQQISVTNSTQASYSLGLTFQAQGDSTTLTTQYSVSNTNYSFTTNQIATKFSSARYLDIPFANSLAPGAYWMIVGMSSTSSTAGAAGLTALTNCNVRYSNHYGVSQANIAPGVMGSTNLTSGGEFGAGSFSTAGGGTTSGFHGSAISTLASNVRMYFRLLRSA